MQRIKKELSKLKSDAKTKVCSDIISKLRNKNDKAQKVRILFLSIIIDYLLIITDLLSLIITLLIITNKFILYIHRSRKQTTQMTPPMKK